MASNYILSICIPTHNRADFLSKNLEKLAHMIDSKNMEIVVGNDGSTDNTDSIISQFVKMHPNIRLVHKRSKKRVFFDRNVIEIVKAASGKFCWLLGDDDVPKTGSILKIKALIEKYPNLSLIHLNYSRFDNLLQKITAKKMINGINKDRLFKNYEDYYFKPIKNSYFKFLGTHTITMSSDVINRGKWLKAIGNLKKYIGHNFIHSFAIGTIIQTPNSVYFVCKPQVQYLSNNHRVWPNDIWKDYNSVLLSYLRGIGYSEKKIEQMRKLQSEYEKREAMVKNKFISSVYRFALSIYKRIK